MIHDVPPTTSSATMFFGDFQNKSNACAVDIIHSARPADMDDMEMKRGAANKRDKTSKAKQG